MPRLPQYFSYDHETTLNNLISSIQLGILYIYIYKFFFIKFKYNIIIYNYNFINKINFIQ